MNEYYMKLSKEKQQEKICLLREWIFRHSNIRLQTPRDFKQLSDLIFQKTHCYISVSTLKRVMAYLPGSGASASISTLDILAKYIGFEGFYDFVTITDKEEASNSMPNREEIKLQIHAVKLQLSNLMEQLELLEGKL